MQDLRNRIVQCQDQLGQTAGLDSLRDRYLAGYIMACADVLNADIEE